MADFFKPAPEPATPLGRLRVLGPRAGVKVSPICLGAMSIGEAWAEMMGSMSKKDSFALLDAFVEAGGNFIDTAVNYQNEESEKWLGEWMAERNNRDQMVIATKYTSGYKSYALGKNESAAFGGNSSKSMHLAIRDSLDKLKTDYVDILYMHWLDYTTSIEEVMDALHVLVQQGKVLYLGVSDCPAWWVAAANTYARYNGKTPFSIYQGRWNLGLRDFERDILPMCRQFGLAICPWDVLGGGRWQTAKQLEAKKQAGEGLRTFFGGEEQTDEEKKISAALEKVAAEHGTESITAIAIAYVMSKAPYVFPLVGGRKIANLKDNIGALSIRLTDEQIAFLEGVKEFDVGFPLSMIGHDPAITGQVPPMTAAQSAIDFVAAPKSISHQ